MNPEKKIIELCKQQGLIDARDVETAGFSRNHLYQLFHDGLLQKTSRGLYQLPGSILTEHIGLIEIAKRYPKAVLCLISALSFHNITSQISPDLWITLPFGSRPPKIKYPPLNITLVSTKAYEYGIQEHNLSGVMVKVYSPAKTIADCFKFRNKVGLDVAIEALREVLRSRIASMEALEEAAKICRVDKVMRAYLEAMV